MDNKMFKKMMDKKKEKPMLSDMEKNAKMSVMEDLKSQANSALGDKLKGLKQVTVAAPDQEGLAEGLDKAEELVGGEEGQEELEEGEDEDEMFAEYKQMSPEDLEKHKQYIEQCLQDKHNEPM